MSTWHILSDADDNRWWEISDSPFPHPKPYVRNPTTSYPPPTLPSMTELLLQGCSKILEGPEDHTTTSSVFRTGSGASIVPKRSSVSKAFSVLGDDTHTDTQLEPRQSDEHGNYSSLFQTASGKKVCASSAALARAKTLLGHDEISHYPPSQGFQSIKGDTLYENNGLTHLAKRRDDARSRGAAKQTQSEMPKTSSTAKASPIKFHTAGGRSISVSADALKRARSLLGDPEVGFLLDKADVSDTVFPVLKERDPNLDYLNKKNDVNSSHYACKKVASYEKPLVSGSVMRDFSDGGSSRINSFKTSPRGALKRARRLLGDPEVELLLNKADVSDAVFPVLKERVPNLDHLNKENDVNSSHYACKKVASYEKPLLSGSVMRDFSDSGSSRINSFKTSPRGALVHKTTTTISTDKDHVTGRNSTCDLKRTGRKTRVSPFKRPRRSKFTNPLNHKIPLVPSGLSTESSENSCYKKRVSPRYPAQSSRIYIKEFFNVPPNPPSNMLQNLTDEVRKMNPANAEKYFFCEGTGSNWIGVEAFHDKLVQSGASLQYASKEWVANHYKWIVWKLACYERLCAAKNCGKFLLVSNVLEELKYRYEREVNHGHRSAIKKILEGDASPSSVLILCISATSPNNNVEVETDPVTIDESKRGVANMIELTDGWYSINAQLDMGLSQYLALGKLFVGQKLRICGARLCDWVQPVSPLEAPKTIKLLLHANGTYRACWADRLGFSRESCTPLAFTCIKSGGGPVPRVLVGVTRIYPLLYRERLGNGACIVRSEKAEAEAVRLYNQRCSNIIEGAMSDICRSKYDPDYANDHDCEGANILKMLENAFEPEVLMAGMSTEQLASVTNYQAKLESCRQLERERSVKKALEDAGLSAREVTPFLRLRIVGLSSEGGRIGKGPKEGLLTIWNPTEKQQLELAEGQTYVMSGLAPLHSNYGTLYLHARGSSSNWQPLNSTERECFEPFFSPRESIPLSKLGEVPPSGEFDTAVLVLYVGKEYTTALQKRLWVFVTDGSISELENNEPTISLLAISFCSSCSDDYAVSPVNSNLVGSIVGLCNVIKRSRDETNDLWVAEATENTTYHLNYDHTRFSHLNQAFASVQKWRDRSTMIVEKLREKVLYIAGDSKI